MDTVNSGDLNALLNRILDETEAAPPPVVDMADESPPSSDVPIDGATGETSDTLPSVSPSPPMGTSPLARLLGNPALLSALPTLLENIGPLMGALSGGVGSAHTATRPHTIDRHTALLCAVKPYLSPERQSAADTVIRLCRVWDALERSGISLSGLLGSIPVTGSPPVGMSGAKDGR